MDKSAVATAILQCRRQLRDRGSFENEQPLSLEDAYQIQSELASSREAEGDSIIGYKLGLISPAKQKQMGVSEPIIGHLHRSMLVQPGEPIVRSRFIQPRVEPELAVVFGRKPPEDARTSDLLSCIAYVQLVVDVLDSIYSEYRFTASDVVADNASGGAIVLSGRPLPPEVLWRQEGQLRLSLDAGKWVEGSLTELGDPITLITWAAEQIRRIGRWIREGDMILLGAPCSAVLIGEARMLSVEGPAGSKLVAPII
ncbi:2-keto-4-pentenoate hydratase [Effusibacillus lacus]|uniref:4-oxalocrotonate decarboxylase n=1 Tax=Effusibacillus lacus TaxID=1348429 RepID=A0A292YQ02_9BACL|nr:fumarylacetoacetate hydrolase family protein [Effusibacillus lacus]TCS76937.1 2-keto-4-pentenoate hydratase [Effusibacillus lacus]GAX91266.1 4-oxalocrotonate decarboxylase [Effusibacillus lacus]